MYMKSISRGSPEIILCAVRNAMTTQAEVGDAVFWHGAIDGSGTTLQDGFSVTYGTTVITGQHNAALFAGVIANNAVPGAAYGEVQMYGLHPGVNVSGSTAVGPFSTAVFTVKTNTANDLANVLLKPANCLFNSGGSAARGYFAPVVMATTVTTQAAANLLQLFPGGYAVVLANPATTATSTSTCTVKAFITALG